jgi:sporulation protein YlmC with PRC-barrel domain
MTMHPPYAKRIIAKRTGVKLAGIFGGAALLMAIPIIVSAPRPPLAQGVQLVEVDIKAIAAGYRTSKLRGANVQNEKNDKIGTLDDIIIGADKERVLFAILQVGGFLGIGAHLVAVPFKSLALDEGGSKITLPGASKDELKKLPEFHYAS